MKRKKSADPSITWRGIECTIVGNEAVTKSDGSIVLCAKIKLVGRPSHQALRLVEQSELVIQPPTSPPSS